MSRPARIVALDDADVRPRKIALGTFDGVHLGHREVIAGSDAVVTFEPHPLSVVSPANAPKLLTTPERKAQLLGELGVQELIVIPFDEAFRGRSAEAFVDEDLVGRLGATSVSVGESFRFGHGARGTPELLQADGRFAVRVVPLLEVDGEIVSSTHIRGLVAGGAVDYASRQLGAPFTLVGPVEHGDARGRTLGYPTANLVPRPGYVLPAHGVYACRVRFAGDDRDLLAATSIGVRPQFVTGRGELVEAFVLDFSEDVYGREMSVSFTKRLRGERKFPSVEALIEQMDADVEQSRRLLA